MCKENGLKQMIHVSALGVENSIDSKYAQSKLEGEKLVKKNFSDATILKPSLVYSVDDSFTTRFFTLLNILPIFPIYYNGRTKFAPIHVTDLAEIIYKVVEKKIIGNTIECIGPQIFSFKEIIKILLNSLDKKRILFNMPLPIAKIFAKTIQSIMPNPIFTSDQLNLLKYDNIPSGNYKTNFDFNINANLHLASEIEKYSYMWKESGQYSKKISD